MGHVPLAGSEGGKLILVLFSFIKAFTIPYPQAPLFITKPIMA